MKMTRHTLILTLLLTFIGAGELMAQSTQSATRHLRRVTLSLVDREPTYEEYQELLAKPEDQREAFIQTQIDGLLASPAFSTSVRLWAKDYLRTGKFYLSSRWTEHLAVQIRPCAEDTIHKGAYSWVYDGNQDLCNDATLNVQEITPWWNTDTKVPTLGSVGDETTFVTTNDGKTIDCGNTNGNRLNNVIPISFSCSCGPNLMYCTRGLSGVTDSSSRNLTAQNRSAIDEPSRLFEYIINQERPFSDLILGNYTVVNEGLYQMYQREARLQHARTSKTLDRNGSQAIREMLDMDHWWKNFSSPSEWKEVKLSQMNPTYLDDRDYKFDPRLTMDDPEGIPSAGVLTTLVAHASFPRERVRAARWLEVLACREFTPPDAGVQFEPFTLDPATGGNCQHCHKAIDPAAMHFKRFYSGGKLRQIYGIANGRLRGGTISPRLRSSFDADTKMTPISNADKEANPDAMLIDFLPPDQTLLGQVSDGTIGPLGFAKMVVASGQFDQCAVRRAYERFGGYYPQLGKDQVLIDQLVEWFTSNGRDMKGLIKHIVTRPESKRGI